MKTLRLLLLGLMAASASFATTIDTTTWMGPGGSLSVLVKPVGAKNAPGLVLAPEWWGLNGYALSRAKELAEQGYVVLAIDLYGGRKIAADAKEAGQLAGAFYADRNKFRTALRTAYDSLLTRPEVDPKRIGALGFCFGGSAVLEAARAGVPFSVVTTFHGGLKTDMPAKPGAITSKILILHGGADPYVPATELAGFIQEMEAAQAKYWVEVYPQAVHAFTNPANGTDPSKGVAYQEAAEVASKKRFTAFLKENGF